jgi:serine/threonine-protein kinase RsbW
MSDVSLTVPGRAEYLRLVRLAAADTGARANLSIEDIEDLRIAVDELTFALMGEKSGDQLLTLHYTAMPGAVEIEGSCAANDTDFVVSDLSRTIIGGVTSEYEVGESGGERRFRLVKRSRA